MSSLRASENLAVGYPCSGVASPHASSVALEQTLSVYARLGCARVGVQLALSAPTRLASAAGRSWIGRFRFVRVDVCASRTPALALADQLKLV